MRKHDQNEEISSVAPCARSLLIFSAQAAVVSKHTFWTNNFTRTEVASVLRKEPVMLSYGLTREFPFSFDTVLTELPKELNKKGFEILSVCHIDQTINALMDITFKRYSIFSVTILPLAYKALVREENFGVVLPCNIAVYENNGETVISTIKPTAFMHVIGNESLTLGATLIERKLQDVLNAFERKKSRIQRSKIPTKIAAFDKAVA